MTFLKVSLITHQYTPKKAWLCLRFTGHRISVAMQNHVAFFLDVLRFATRSTFSSKSP